VSAWTQGFLLGCAVGFFPWCVLMLLVLLEHRRERRDRRPGYIHPHHHHIRTEFMPRHSNTSNLLGPHNPYSADCDECRAKAHARQHGVTTPNTGKETL